MDAAAKKVSYRLISPRTINAPRGMLVAMAAHTHNVCNQFVRHVGADTVLLWPPGFCILTCTQRLALEVVPRLPHENMVKHT